VLTIRELTPDEVGLVDRYLPLSRLDQHDAQGSTYLIAWEDDEPVGHATLPGARRISASLRSRMSTCHPTVGVTAWRRS
jgi:hypothetical protein